MLKLFRICAQNKDLHIFSLIQSEREKEKQKNPNLQETAKLYCIVLFCLGLFCFESWLWLLPWFIILCGSFLVLLLWCLQSEGQSSQWTVTVFVFARVTHHDTWNLVQHGIFLSSRLHLRDSRHHNPQSCGGKIAMPRVTVENMWKFFGYASKLERLKQILKNMKHSLKMTKAHNMQSLWQTH